MRSEATWAAAREAYLAGAGAGEVCEQFDLGLTALRDRARREGWRRRDQADPEPASGPAEALAVGELDPDDLDPDDLDPEALAEEVMMERAWRMAARALGRGRLREAQGWTRLVSDLKAAGETRRAAAISAAVRTPDYASLLEGALATVERARRTAALPQTAAYPDGLDSLDAPRSADRAPDIERARSAGLSRPTAAPPGEPARPEPALNRAERRRQARLAVQRPRDGP